MSINWEKLTAPFDNYTLRPGPKGLNVDGSPWMILFKYISGHQVEDRLDDVLGKENWQKDLQMTVDGKTWVCRLSIKIDGQWVSKADSGDSEDPRGGATNAFVRAAKVWGIGRDLYREKNEYAEFVQKGTQRAKKVEIDGKAFYYVEPEIVEDATSETEDETQKAAAIKQAPNPFANFNAGVTGFKEQAPPQRKAETKPIPKEPPKPYAGEPKRIAPRSDYVVTFGSTQGKRLDEHTVDEIQSLMSFLDKVKTPKGAAKECKEALAEFVAGRKQIVGG
jgi:hypothetical protein